MAVYVFLRSVLRAAGLVRIEDAERQRLYQEEEAPGNIAGPRRAVAGKEGGVLLRLSIRSR